MDAKVVLDPPARFTRRRTRFAAFILAFVMVFSGLTTLDQYNSALPAQAASWGAGFQGATPNGSYLGNFIGPGGVRIYCIDSNIEDPVGADTDPGVLVSSFTTNWSQSYSGVNLQKMNYALLRYGQTADNVTAAAVAAVIYAYTSSRARDYGVGYAAGLYYIDGNSAITTAYTAIWNDVQANYNAAAAGTASLSITMLNSYDGSVTVSTNPTSATGTLTLEGATVAATGATSVAVRHGSVIQLKGNPLDAQNKYSITANASFTASGGAAANVNLYSSGAYQRTVSGGRPNSISFSARAFVTDPLALEFAPVVATKVASRYVQPGDAFVDELTADVAEGSEAWRQRVNGSYFSIVAQGTLYGPFVDEPTPSALPPAGAPVVGTETVSLDGPGTYSSPGTLSATDRGFYTWVWTIDAADQTIVTQAQLPENYTFADQFGLQAETHVVAVGLTAESQASPEVTGVGGTVSDQLTVSLTEGEWLTSGGSPVPAEFTGEAYFIAGDTAPEVSATVPAEAVLLGTATITATAPGVYDASATVSAPAAEAGFVSWVWKLDPENAFAPYFTSWADQFGLPSETTRVELPKVSSKAMTAVALGDPVHDTAIVEGQMPALPATLEFQAYLQPEGSEEPICDAATLVYDSSAVPPAAGLAESDETPEPIIVTEEGEYRSHETRFTEYGTYFWVESLYANTGELLHRGECGLPNETTLVEPATVVTEAVPTVGLGDPAHDSAIVEGLTPQGATLVFAAYKQQALGLAVCTPANEVFNSSNQPVAVTGAGTYTSPTTVFKELGTYFWVETLLDRDGEVLHEGKCGAANETTRVKELPFTGGTFAAAVPLAWGSALLLLLGMALVIQRRRKNS